MNTFEKVLGFVAEKMAWIAMFAIVACMALVISDVVLYQAVHEPLPGTHEVVELIAAVILSMGIGYLTFVKGHVAVGILVDHFRPRVQAVFDLLTGVISLGFTIWLTQGMLEHGHSKFQIRVGDRSSGNSQGSFYVFDWRVTGTRMRGSCQGRDQGGDGDPKRRLRWSES